MKILIIEDEPVHARYLTGRLNEILGKEIEQIIHKASLAESIDFLQDNKVDLLFLDLNLYGDNGFEILKKMPTTSVFTIIVSANTNLAIEAFEYGVLDFIAKPVEDERLIVALKRYSTFQNKYSNSPTNFSFSAETQIKEKKYAKTRLQNVNLEELQKQLHSLIEENKIFKDENLSLEKLAEKMNLHPRQLSEYLNGKLKLSYISYIQKHRIEEAKKILLEFPKMSITEVGYEVGFKSLSSFYEIFKEVTGMTAGEFREKN